MITTSNQFIYPKREVLPHSIHIVPYPINSQPTLIPKQCKCGFYDNIYNSRNGNSFICCNCGRTNEIGINNSIPSSQATITTETHESSIERKFLFIISLQLEIVACQEMLKNTIREVSSKGYKVGCIFFNEDTIHYIKNSNRTNINIIPGLKGINELPININSLWLNREMVENSCNNILDSLPFVDLIQLHQCLDGWSKTMELVNQIVVPGVEIVSFINTNAKQLPFPLELSVPLHMVFPDKYQSDIYPIILHYIRTHGGSIHAWDRHTSQTYNDSIQSLINDLESPRTNGGSLTVLCPPQIQIVSSTLARSLSDKVFPKKKKIFDLPPTTSKTHCNISVVFKEKKGYAKTVLHSQFIYKDSLDFNGTHFDCHCIETIKFTLVSSIVEYYNSMVIGASIQSLFYTLPDPLELKKRLKQYLLAFSIPHYQFLTFLKICNYLLSSPLYSKTNPHLSSLYQHLLLDSDPHYVFSLYNPVVYVFQSLTEQPQATYSLIKKSLIKQIQGVGVVFLNFGKVVVLCDDPNIHSEGNQIGMLVNSLRYDHKFPVILNELVIPFNGSELLEYCMLDDNELNSFKNFISDLNRLILK